MTNWLLALCLLLTGCSKNDPTLKVAATPVPHAEMLNEIKDDLKKQGINLEIIVVEDYNIPNRALADGEVDANFFQHEPFLNAQKQAFGYKLLDFAKVHIEPMGLYSSKYHELDQIPDKAVICIPNDPTNEARALALLQKHGLIRLDDSNNLNATIHNIVENPKKFTFEEVDAAMLARSLPDVDAALITTNFAMQAGLSPMVDALIMEDGTSVYTNIIAIRQGDEKRSDLQALKSAMNSNKMREFILNRYHGAIIPAF